MKVAIVAPGRSVLGRTRGSLIDAADRVLRVGDLCIIGHEADVGRRTDYWVTSRMPSPECRRGGWNPRQELAQHITGIKEIWLFPRRENNYEYLRATVKKLCGDKPPGIFEPDGRLYRSLYDWTGCDKKIGNRPSTGLAAAAMALFRLLPDQLLLVGYDNLLNPEDTYRYLWDEELPAGLGGTRHNFLQERRTLLMLCQKLGFAPVAEDGGEALFRVQTGFQPTHVTLEDNVDVEWGRLV